MRGARICIFPAAIAVALWLDREASANAIAPRAYFFPGVLPATLGLALPASILAAFLERPFVSAAGVRRRPLVASLQANFLSLLLGYLLLPIGMPALYAVGALWSLISVAISIGSEFGYYRMRGFRQIEWWRIALANVASSAVLVTIPWFVLAFEEASPYLVRRWSPYGEAIFWPVVAGSLLTFVVACCTRLGSHEEGPVAEPDKAPALAASDLPGIPS